MDSTWIEQQLCAQQCTRHHGCREERDQVQDIQKFPPEQGPLGPGEEGQRRDLRVTLKSNAGHVSMQWLIFFLLYWFCGFCHVVEDQATVNIVHSRPRDQHLPF